MPTQDTGHPDERIQRILDAIEWKRGGQQARIAQIGLDWLDLLLRKNADYGGSVFKVPRLAPECSPGTALRVRMSDKIERLEQLLRKNTPEVAESLEDTIRDLGAYCLLYLCRPQSEDHPCPLPPPEKSQDPEREALQKVVEQELANQFKVDLNGNPASSP